MRYKKIMLFMTVWQRRKITLPVFDHIKQLQQNINLDVFIAYSEHCWKKILREYNFKGTFIQNDRLGFKHNEAMQRCLDHDFDYLMQLGSDDYINPLLFSIYNWKEEVFGINRCYAYNISTDQFRIVHSKDIAIGAGRVFKREVLEKLCDNILIGYYKVRFLKSGRPFGFSYGKGEKGIVSADHLSKLKEKGIIEIIDQSTVKDYEKVYTKRMFNILHGGIDFKYSNYNKFYMWPDDSQRGLDTKSQMYLANNGIQITIYDTDKPLIVDIKGDHHNINSWDNFWQNDQKISRILKRKGNFLSEVRKKARRGYGVYKSKGRKG